MRLRPLSVADAPQLFKEYFGDAEVSRHLSFKTHVDESETRQHIAKLQGNAGGPNSHTFALIRDDEPERVLGIVGVAVSAIEPDKYDAVEIGFGMVRDRAARRGAKDFLRALLAYLWTLPTVCRVWGFTDIQNELVLRLNNRLGFRTEGLIRGHIVRPQLGDAPRDSWVYSMTRSDWNAQH
ncbi:hypothetical protein AOQ71_31615 [Bradyrhizobium manausense]|uniref:N-acetyltransferase domain-containing protein n=2 Tax=Bradyrhizobium manausense TaxID=989370 RepID=A0A0R3D4S3_9BRAD|nr:hypothetical protein AOQ71_31615 [Bradyrhizobium manausense]